MKRLRWFSPLALGLLAASVMAAPTPSSVTGMPPPEKAQVSSEDALANVRGKYRVLLHKLHLPQDLQGYGQFRDWGMWNGTSYYNFQNLTPGYWVYHYPHWYIWKECVNPNIQMQPIPAPGQPGAPGGLPGGGIQIVPDGGIIIPPGAIPVQDQGVRPRILIKPVEKP